MTFSLTRKTSRPVPPHLRKNFLHLYLDIGWFGILSGSAMAFISVYLVRIGASDFQVGMMTAVPAIVALACSLPAGWWLNRRPVDRAVFHASVLFRFFYLLWIPLPLLAPAPLQIWLILAITLVMSIPGTALNVGFNALFADAVPPEWRGRVVGTRNATLAISLILASLLSGWLLQRLPYPANYQVVFALGFMGAMLSSAHLNQVRVHGTHKGLASQNGHSLGDLSAPGGMRGLGDGPRVGVGLRFLTRLRTLHPPRFSILRGPFGPILLALFTFHFTQYLPIPLYPIFVVQELQVSDQAISLGNALFYIFTFAGATQLGRITDKIGNHLTLILGAVMLTAYPAMLALTQGLGMYFLTSAVGGLFSVLAGGALGNYLLDRVPEDERPMHLAWYMLATNAAILGGSLLGPALSASLGLIPALWIAAAGRALSGVTIWYWGR